MTDQPAQPLNELDALEVINAALEQYAKIRADTAGDGEGRGLVLEWSLVYAEHFDRGDGTSVTGLNLLGYPEGLAPHRALGLIEWGRRRLLRLLGDGA